MPDKKEKVTWEISCYNKCHRHKTEKTYTSTIYHILDKIQHAKTQSRGSTTLNSNCNILMDYCLQLFDKLTGSLIHADQ
jgi:hypothetical protein